MELKKEIKLLVDNKGSRFILYPQFINILTDYQAFADNQALKYVLNTFIEEGYVEKLISLEENQLPIGDIALRYFNELYSKYGFRRDVSLLVVNAIIFALNIEDNSYCHSRLSGNSAYHRGISHSTPPSGSMTESFPPDIVRRHPTPRQSALHFQAPGQTQDSAEAAACSSGIRPHSVP